MYNKNVINKTLSNEKTLSENTSMVVNLITIDPIDLCHLMYRWNNGSSKDYTGTLYELGQCGLRGGHGRNSANDCWRYDIIV